MRIAGRHEFGISREAVWEALHDQERLAAALPGARRLESTGDDAYALSVDVGVGSVKGTYEGTFALSEQRAPEACTVTARARGGPGSVEAVARMRLSERDGGGALLEYEADATVTGPLAGVGQRLIGGAAKRTTERFLAALEQEVAAPAVEPAAPRRELAAPAARGARPDPVVIAVSALAGAAAALLGVAVGRWTSRR
jgi:carbon monoxide dehydrogenase subunit G